MYNRLVTCGKCRGLLVQAQADGFLEERCLICGSLRFLDVPTNGNGHHNGAWASIVPTLPDSFKVLDLLRYLFDTQREGWTAVRLNTLLEAEGFEIARIPTETGPGPLWASREKQRSVGPSVSAVQPKLGASR